MKQVMVLTGGAGGLGQIFAKELAKDGHAIAILDYNTAAAQAVAQEICQAGGQAIGVHCDVTNKASGEAAREVVRQTFGKCNVLINAAGVHDVLVKTTHPAYQPGDEAQTEVNKVKNATREAYDDVLAQYRSFMNLDPQRMMGVMNINWLGTFVMSQVFAVDLVGTEGNSIINITSMAAYEALSMIPAYASSKAAVDMTTRWLSNYLSNVHGQVRVNAVAPGFFLTALNRDLYVNPDGTHTQRYLQVINRTPMGRFGKPEELVGSLRFLADASMSGYITGQVIAVDGGFLACPGI